MTDIDGAAGLGRLAEEYFQLTLDADPCAATLLGVPGHDGQMPDPSRAADRRQAARLSALADELAALPPGGDPVTRSMLDRLIADRRAGLAAALSEVSVSAGTFGVLSELLAVVPQAPLTDPGRAASYLERLAAIGGYLDGVGERYRQAAGDGRMPTALGVRQTVEQIEAYLGTDPAADPLLRPTPPSGVDAERWRGRAAGIVDGGVRPALRRLRDTLAGLAAGGRDDAHVGIGAVPGGAEGYRAAVRAHTTTELTPEEIHRTGLDALDRLRAEFAELGGRSLGLTELPAIADRLRGDPALRFDTGPRMLAHAGGVLARVYEALPDWFRGYDGLARCEVREMDPLEATGGVLGYYLEPAADGSRAGGYVLNTTEPASRPRFEYEALAFHESVPGHHLQIAVGQAQTDLPAFRRFAILNAHVEGWGLYAERLADDMGLYTGDLDRLGMLSFEAWRACRLVVDTGMHAMGWSRSEAIAFLGANTALSESNVVNEIDRYIAEPGQALAYLTGQIRIQRLREEARRRLGPAFDIRDFHHQVLSHGAVPLDTLTDLVEAWITSARRGGAPAPARGR